MKSYFYWNFLSLPSSICDFSSCFHIRTWRCYISSSGRAGHSRGWFSRCLQSILKSSPSHGTQLDKLPERWEIISNNCLQSLISLQVFATLKTFYFHLRILAFTQCLYWRLRSAPARLHLVFPTITPSGFSIGTILNTNNFLRFSAASVSLVKKCKIPAKYSHGCC